MDLSAELPRLFSSCGIMVAASAFVVILTNDLKSKSEVRRNGPNIAGWAGLLERGSELCTMIAPISLAVFILMILVLYCITAYAIPQVALEAMTASQKELIRIGASVVLLFQLLHYTVLGLTMASACWFKHHPTRRGS